MASLRVRGNRVEQVTGSLSISSGGGGSGRARGGIFQWSTEMVLGGTKANGNRLSATLESVGLHQRLFARTQAEPVVVECCTLCRNISRSPA
jgi:hypothetical protein